jgi:hypothetical protein
MRQVLDPLDGRHRALLADGSPAILFEGQEAAMRNKPDPNSPVADEAPDGPSVTSYDELHFIHYIRLLDADAEGVDWREVALIVLGIDPSKEPDRARRAYETHMARARWMTEHGYRDLLRAALH